MHASSMLLACCSPSGLDVQQHTDTLHDQLDGTWWVLEGLHQLDISWLDGVQGRDGRFLWVSIQAADLKVSRDSVDGMQLIMLVADCLAQPFYSNHNCRSRSKKMQH